MQTEPTAVQLTRIEGTLNLVAFQIKDVAARVDRHESEIGALKSQTQSLREGADASEGKAVALALALKDAKETQEATSRAESAKAAAASREEAARSALGWSPITRLFAVAAGILGAILIFQALTGG